MPPDFVEHLIEDYDLNEVFRYLNPQTLYCSHLGLRGNYSTLLAKKDPKLLKLALQVEEVKRTLVDSKSLHPRAIYRFFECNKVGNSILIYDGDKIAQTLEFPRQQSGEHLCLADFVCTKEEGRDSLGFFVVSVGHAVIEHARELRNRGDYVKSHLLQVVALECAESFAEIVHKKMRELWGILDSHLTTEQIVSAQYAGKRFSYGYPACPDLEEQRKLFALLTPEKIGVHLTESMMMEPEASISALVFYNPQCKHFTI